MSPCIPRPSALNTTHASNRLESHREYDDLRQGLSNNSPNQQPQQPILKSHQENPIWIGLGSPERSPEVFPRYRQYRQYDSPIANGCEENRVPTIEAYNTHAQPNQDRRMNYDNFATPAVPRVPVVHVSSLHEVASERSTNMTSGSVCVKPKQHSKAGTKHLYDKQILRKEYCQ